MPRFNDDSGKLGHYPNFGRNPKPSSFQAVHYRAGLSVTACLQQLRVPSAKRCRPF